MKMINWLARLIITKFQIISGQVNFSSFLNQFNDSWISIIWAIDSSCLSFVLHRASQSIFIEFMITQLLSSSFNCWWTILMIRALRNDDHQRTPRPQNYEKIWNLKYMILCIYLFFIFEFWALKVSILSFWLRYQFLTPFLAKIISFEN